jgi:hypothetical protein
VTAECGLAPPCRIRVERARGEALAVAVEEETLEAIDGALAAAGVRAVSIRPWWAHVLADALRKTPSLRALTVWEGRALTILTGEGEGFASAQTMFPVDRLEVASAAVARALVSSMIPSEDALALWLDWSRPDAGSSVPIEVRATPFSSCVRALGAVS